MVSIPGLGVVQFHAPVLLLAIPVSAVALWALVLRPSRPSDAGRRFRFALFASRLTIAACLVVAAAGPYTVVTKQTPGQPRVTLLVDDSASTGVAAPVADQVQRGIQAAGVPVSRVVIASGNASRLGDGIVANTVPDGSLVVVSDGQVTGGRSLAAAAEVARSANATVNAVPLAPNRAERYVRLSGPRKTSVGVDNAFLVSVDGADIAGEAVPVTVSIDGVPAFQGTITGPGSRAFSHRFNQTGPHELTARLGDNDVYRLNNVYRKTVQVVNRPRILYVSRTAYPLADYLSQLYDVTRASSVPQNLDPYYAVVLQDLNAAEIEHVQTLQRFVIDGNGLLVVGGPHAFDHGAYENTPFSSMLPVQIGTGSQTQASIVLTIDISGSTAGGMRIQKALALDVLDQLGDQNRVGVVAFNDQAYRIADPAPLATSRTMLADRIRRLQSGGGTHIVAGLNGAAQLLGGGGGTVILISDGQDLGIDGAVHEADQLGTNGVKVITIGVGQQIDAGALQRIAAASGGTYYRASETNRLRITFGDATHSFSANRLTIVDSTHFITAGVTLTASLPDANQVSVKGGADHLVATGTGSPAVAAWRYGLGRVVSVTAYGPTGGLDGLLARPDSLLVSKATNWAIGDPNRKAVNVADVPDTTVGETTTVTYTGSSRPNVPEVAFQRIGNETYQGSITPATTGYASILGTAYAVNYPAEFAGFGVDPALTQAVTTTGGRVFTPGDGAAIAVAATRHATQLREVREDWSWVFLLAALLVFLGDVAGRRLLVYRRRTPP